MNGGTFSLVPLPESKSYPFRGSQDTIYLKRPLDDQKQNWGAWVVQLVKRPTLDTGSGHDLTVGGNKPCIGLYAKNMEPAWDSLSAPPLLVLFLSK